jgi:hypothetical protein
MTDPAATRDVLLALAALLLVGWTIALLANLPDGGLVPPLLSAVLIIYSLWFGRRRGHAKA